MAKIFFILGVLFLPGGLVFAQETSADSAYKLAYKLDLFRAAQGTIQFGIEKKVSPKFSANVAIMGTYASTRGLAKPYLKAQNFEFEDVMRREIYRLEHVEVLGYGVNFQFRRYLGKSPEVLSGYYLSPEVFFRQLALKSDVVDYNTQLSRRVSKSLLLGYIGYMGGYQLIIKQAIALDMYVGGGFFLSKYGNENQLTKYRNSFQMDYSGFYLNTGILLGIIK